MSVTLTHQDISHYLFTPTDAKSLGKTSLPCLPDDSGGGGVVLSMLKKHNTKDPSTLTLFRKIGMTQKRSFLLL